MTLISGVTDSGETKNAGITSGREITIADLTARELAEQQFLETRAVRFGLALLNNMNPDELMALASGQVP